MTSCLKAWCSLAELATHSQDGGLLAEPGYKLRVMSDPEARFVCLFFQSTAPKKRRRSVAPPSSPFPPLHPCWSSQTSPEPFKNAEPSSLPARGRKPLHSDDHTILFHLDAPSAVQQRPLLAHLVKTQLLSRGLPKRTHHQLQQSQPWRSDQLA